MITFKKAQTSRTHGAVCEADDKLTVLYPNLDSVPENAIAETDMKTKLTKLASRNVHGKYSELHKRGTEKEATHTWLRISDIFAETGGFITLIGELPEDDTSCVETCRSSLFVIYAIIVTDIYVYSLVELKIKN